MINIVINGFWGKMGQEVFDILSGISDLKIIGGVDLSIKKEDVGIPVFSEPEKILPATDVVIDFSSPEGAVNIASVCLEHQKPLVTGTTGLSEQQQKVIFNLAETVPVVQASNFSVGVNLVNNLLKIAVLVLEKGFDVEIIDIHHRMKKDSPSGTAMSFAKIIAETLDQSPETIKFGREGKNLSRENEITVHSLRGGSVIGKHEIYLMCKNENIVITHEALSRRVFVDGVLRAVRWIIDQRPGYYTMQHVLNLSI